jgi:hypothetical protein
MLNVDTLPCQISTKVFVTRMNIVTAQNKNFLKGRKSNSATEICQLKTKTRKKERKEKNNNKQDKQNTCGNLILIEIK